MGIHRIRHDLRLPELHQNADQDHHLPRLPRPRYGGLHRGGNLGEEEAVQESGDHVSRRRSTVGVRGGGYRARPPATRS